MCTSRVPRRSFFPREEARLLIVSLEVLTSCMTICTCQRHKVTLFDVPGAHSQVHLLETNFILLKLEEKCVNIICEINPGNSEQLTIENSFNVLCLQIKKKIYGMVESTLLQCELHVIVRMCMVFALNPYDMSVANKMISGNQCTLTWFADYNKVSPVRQAVMDDIIKNFE